MDENLNVVESESEEEPEEEKETKIGTLFMNIAAIWNMKIIYLRYSVNNVY